jgi:uncharacterized membrane protein YfcA
LLPDYSWLLAYLALGSLTGWLGGLFGIGGGLLLVPVLAFLFQAQGMPASHLLQLSLGSAMGIILFTSLASLRKHHQLGGVHWPTFRALTPGILLGTGFGTWIAAQVPASFLAIFFACFVYLVAGQMWLGSKPPPARRLPGTAGMTAFGIITGSLSSLVSIGGGTFVVPFLVWCNVPLRNAIGTASATGFPLAAGASLGYAIGGWDVSGLPAPHAGFGYLPAIFWTGLASLFTAPIGARLAHRLDVEKLRKLFALLLAVLATKLLTTTI